jgi:HEAT repeat protein
MDEVQPESPVDGSRTAGQTSDQPAERLHVRWFLIPLGIVSLLVGGWWLLFRLLTGPPDPLELIETMRDPSHESWQQAYAFVELLQDPQSTKLRSDPAACRAVADLLAGSLDRGDCHPKAVKSQVFLCRAVGEFHVADGLSVLLRAAEQRSANALQVRCAAIESIAVLASHAPWTDSPHADRVVPTLLAATQETIAAQDDVSPARLAATATFACGVVGGEAACAQLRQLLHDVRPEVRYNAATGLARHGDEQCIPVLVEMLTTAEHSSLAATSADGDRARMREVLVRNAVRAIRQLSATHPRAQVSTLRDAMQAQLDSSDLPVGLRMEVQAALAELDRAALSEAHRGSL